MYSLHCGEKWLQQASITTIMRLIGVLLVGPGGRFRATSRQLPPSSYRMLDASRLTAGIALGAFIRIRGRSRDPYLLISLSRLSVGLVDLTVQRSYL